MNENTKNIIKKPSTIITAIIAVLLSFGVGNVTHIGTDQGYLPYSCAQENVDDMFCYKLSRVGKANVNSYCYYDRDRPAKYKECNAGWNLMTSAIETEPTSCPSCPTTSCPVLSCPTISCPTQTQTGCPGGTRVIAYMPDGTKYWCEGIGPGQKCKSTDEILSELG